MRTDLKVGVICVFAVVLASVGFFAYHSNKPEKTVGTTLNRSAVKTASVAAPNDAPTTAPSAVVTAPQPAPSLASAFGPSHALGADTYSGPTILPPSATTAPASTPLIPPSNSTGLGAPGNLSAPGGLSGPSGLSAPGSLHQPLVPSGGTGLGLPGSTSLNTGGSGLLPSSTGPSGVNTGLGTGSTGTSGFGNGGLGTSSGSSRNSALEIGPTPSHTSSSSSTFNLPGFGATSNGNHSSSLSNGEYAIQKGDTLGALAKKNHTTTKAILAANPGVNPNRLKVGQKIKIPEASSSSSSSGTLGGLSLPGSSTLEPGLGGTTTKPATKGKKGGTGSKSSQGTKGSASQSSLAGGTYTIKKGDTLRKIAKAVYGDERLWRRIFRANRGDLASPNAIKVGEVIHLPK